MKGNIYTSQKCHICGAALRNDENRDGCFCLVHPDVRAHGPVRVRFGSLRRRFQNYELARRMLTEWRSLSDRNEFNVRDWEAANPRGFRTLSYRWLETKKSVSKRYHQNLTNYIGKAVEEWKDRNVKTIQYGEIEDFILSLDVSDKTRHNTLEGLKQFFRWAAKRERIPIPEFPEIEFTLGWREIIDTETQSAIINEVERIAPPRIFLGIKWLATYVAIRPHELRELREADINVNGFIVCRPATTKEKKPKLVPMLDEDIDLYNSLPEGLPHLHFFRNGSGKGISAERKGQQIGRGALYNWWKRACNNLGINGVDLYGGTRHSTTTALSKHFSKEELRTAGTMHGTNKAFERYMQNEAAPSREIYAKARQILCKQKANILPFKKAEDS